MNILRNIAIITSRLSIPDILKKNLIKILIKINNTLVGFRSNPGYRKSGVKELDEVLQKSLKRTVINEHLPTLFFESIKSRPSLIVELGVETGNSTFVFERVARLTGATLLSVDINDCSEVCSWDGWNFVQSGDLEFAGEFDRWCRERGRETKIDILFIDTTHNFEYTLKEIEHWFPKLSEKGKVFFHDSNLKSIMHRRDGTFDRTRDFQRGVMMAIEKYIGGKFDESKDFITIANGWLVTHHANCNGLTILEKLPLDSPEHILPD